MSVQTSTWASQPGAGADADGRDAQLLGDPLGEVGGDDLEHDREGAGLLQRERVLEQPVAGLAAALDPVAAHRVDRLRGQAEVAHDRDAGADEQLDLRAARRRPPSSLTACAPTCRKRTALASACSGLPW